MAVFKRKGSARWQIEFVHDRERYQKSSGTTNKKAAEDIERQWRIELAKGAVGLVQKKPAPTLKDFSKRFLEYVEVRNHAKPRTVQFYREQTKRLLEFEPMAKAALDRIDERLIEEFVQARRQTVSVATVNRGLATFKKLMRLAQEWREIDRVPRIRLLGGETPREFVLSHTDEQIYLEFAPQPLKDVALLMIDTGLRLGEALALKWSDVSYSQEPDVSKAVHVRDGKSRNAKRSVPITSRVASMLSLRREQSEYEHVFATRTGIAMQVTSLDHLHAATRKKLKMPDTFVLHSLRHTFLTRLGAAGVDAFVIMKTAGHHSVTVSQRYVHPHQSAVEIALGKLESYNANQQQQKPQAPA